MNRNEITEKTKEIFNEFLSEYYGVASPEYANDENVVDKFSLDSLDLAELTFELEEKLNVEIPDDSFKYKTINEFVDTIEKLIK